MGAPTVTVLAGPNRAGKSTAAPFLLEKVNIADFVNADVIARGLSAGRPESVAIAAGRLMLKRMNDLATKRLSFAFRQRSPAEHSRRGSRDLSAKGTSSAWSSFRCPHPKWPSPV